MNITFRQLRLFLALAETGSVSGAAKLMHVTQPTASMQLKDITESVGLPLYEVISKKIYLTDMGKELATTARAIAPDTQGTYMIVDFGKTRMGVGIVYNKTLMYTSTIEISGTQMSNDMREILGDVAESELTKIKMLIETRSDNSGEIRKSIPDIEKYADFLEQLEEIGEMDDILPVSKNIEYDMDDILDKIKKISKNIELIDIKRGIKETIQFYHEK